MALNKAQQAEADSIVADLMTASTWISGARSHALASLAKRVASLANLEDPAPEIPAISTPAAPAAPEASVTP